MVRSVTPEDDIKILDKKKNSKRFAYVKKNSDNPWGKFGDNLNDGVISCDIAPFKTPIQNRINTNSMKKEFDLDNVWSIRNNVSVATKKSPTSTIKPGIYSRHNGLSIVGTNSKAGLLKQQQSNDTPYPDQQTANQKTSRYALKR